MFYNFFLNILIAIVLKATNSLYFYCEHDLYLIKTSFLYEEAKIIRVKIHDKTPLGPYSNYGTYCHSCIVLMCWHSGFKIIYRYTKGKSFVWPSSSLTRTPLTETLFQTGTRFWWCIYDIQYLTGFLLSLLSKKSKHFFRKFFGKLPKKTYFEF